MNKMNTTWLKGLALFFIATFLGFFFASQSYLSYLYRGYEANFMTSLQFILPDWYVWALFTPLIVWLSRRLRFGREHWLRNIFVHLIVGLLVTVAKMFVLSLLTGWIPWLPHRPWSLVQTHPNLVTYWVILGLSHGFDYYRKFREKELRTSQLEGRLAKTQLQVLKMQLQPHFLFNTLHAISALMHTDVEAADRMMARLSDLLRLTLENTGVHEVSLKQELEFLQGYLEIEQTRFKDRLSIRTEIDPATLDARVPNLILQPLVENAIRHGIEPYKRAGKVEILTKRSNGRLHVIIRDDGPGMANGKKPLEEGIGLSNTRARLEQLYGQNFELEIGSQNEHGFVVNLSIPLILATDLH